MHFVRQTASGDVRKVLERLTPLACVGMTKGLEMGLPAHLKEELHKVVV